MLSLLEGTRVLDATTIVLGPYAGRTLADMGAEVVKLEAPEGDLFRYAGPQRAAGMGSGYMNSNLSKRSVALDLKRSESRRALEALVGRADIFLHNMRPAAARRLGLDWETLRGVNPRLVYCVSAGWGSEGPESEAPAYDDVLQGASGLAALNADSEGRPRYVSSIVCDKVTGLHMALAALGGLARRDRTGEGCRVEAPMLESMASFLLVEHLGGRSFDPPLGSTGYPRLMAASRRPWPTKDGHIAALPYTTRQWRGFFALAGREDLANAEWIGNASERAARAGELYALAESLTARETTAWWLEGLRERSVPCAPVRTMDGLLDEDEHLGAVGMFERYRHSTEGDLVRVRSPFRVTGRSGGAERPGPASGPAPRLGEHSREALMEAGLSEGEVEALVAAGVLVEPERAE